MLSSYSVRWVWRPNGFSSVLKRAIRRLEDRRYVGDDKVTDGQPVPWHHERTV